MMTGMMLADAALALTTGVIPCFGRVAMKHMKNLEREFSETEGSGEEGAEDMRKIREDLSRAKREYRERLESIRVRARRFSEEAAGDDSCEEDSTEIPLSHGKDAEEKRRPREDRNRRANEILKALQNLEELIGDDAAITIEVRGKNRKPKAGTEQMG